MCVHDIAQPVELRAGVGVLSARSNLAVLDQIAQPITVEPLGHIPDPVGHGGDRVERDNAARRLSDANVVDHDLVIGRQVDVAPAFSDLR